ncbi:MAG: hypothetical protein MUC85_01795 [Anaerolineales bacterium]|jgi:hypothetical protein|nr:hypothetical protein [Anaerolineales bacterium]
MNLLQELIRITSEESLATPASLAKRLQVSQGLIELMLADLEKSGYLQAVIPNCGSCEGCGIRQACGSNPPRLWVRSGKKVM